MADAKPVTIDEKTDAPKGGNKKAPSKAKAKGRKLPSGGKILTR